MKCWNCLRRLLVGRKSDGGIILLGRAAQRGRGHENSTSIFPTTEDTEPQRRRRDSKTVQRDGRISHEICRLCMGCNIERAGMMRRNWTSAMIVSVAVVAFAGAPATEPNSVAALKLESLNGKFALLGDHLRFVAGEGGLVCAEIKTETCTGRIFLQGAHVAAWQPVGQEPVIFMSSKGTYAEGHPIRGGVPIAFPWFANQADDATARCMGWCGRWSGRWRRRARKGGR